VVVAVAELLAPFGSASCALTVAVLTIVPFAVGFTVMVTVAFPPFGMVPRLQVTCCLLGFTTHVPCEAVAEPKPAFFGSVSVTVTPVAEEGPLLATLSV